MPFHFLQKGGGDPSGENSIPLWGLKSQIYPRFKLLQVCNASHLQPARLHITRHGRARNLREEGEPFDSPHGLTEHKRKKQSSFGERDRRPGQLQALLKIGPARRNENAAMVHNRSLSLVAHHGYSLSRSLKPPRLDGNFWSI